MIQSVLLWLLLALLALHLALALLTRHLTREAEAAHPPIGRFVLREDGSRIHYLESGPIEGTDATLSPTAAPLTDGARRATAAPEAALGRTPGERWATEGSHDIPTIVLVHGASTSLLDFETSLRPHLERTFRVVALDRPGSGWSDPLESARGDPLAQAADVVRVLDALGIERAIWVGHSWGGAVVMAALLEHESRVAAGVAIAAATHPWEGALPRSIRLAAVPVVGHLLAACWAEPIGRRVLDDALADSFRPESPPRGVVRYRESTGAMLTIRPASFRSTALDLVGLSESLAALVPRYGEIRRPLLLVNGAEDPTVPPERNADRVAAVLPAAIGVRVPNAGHIVHHTHAALVATSIADFSERHADAGPSNRIAPPIVRRAPTEAR